MHVPVLLVQILWIPGYWFYGISCNVAVPFASNNPSPHQDSLSLSEAQCLAVTLWPAPTWSLKFPCPPHPHLFSGCSKPCPLGPSLLPRLSGSVNGSMIILYFAVNIRVSTYPVEERVFYWTKSSVSPRLAGQVKARICPPSPSFAWIIGNYWPPLAHTWGLWTEIWVLIYTQQGFFT